jgi:hypothetical protein
LSDCKCVDTTKSEILTGYIENIAERTKFLPAKSFGIRVQAEKNSLVNEGVLLLRPGPFLNFMAGGAYNRLDFITVDQTSNIRVRNLGSGQPVAVSKIKQ